MPWFGDALEVVSLDIAWILEVSHLVLELFGFIGFFHVG